LIITQLSESVCVHVRERVSRTVTSDRRERVCCTIFLFFSLAKCMQAAAAAAAATAHATNAHAFFLSLTKCMHVADHAMLCMQ
jgi:hypothetical protein